MDQSQPFPSGPALLDAYLIKRGIKRSDAAKQLTTSASAIHYWINGGQRPRADVRKRIERWTGGEVPEASWLNPEEIQELASQKEAEVTAPEPAKEPAA